MISSDVSRCGSVLLRHNVRERVLSRRPHSLQFVAEHTSCIYEISHSCEKRALSQRTSACKLMIRAHALQR